MRSHPFFVTLALAAPAAAQSLVVPGSTHDVVAAFDHFDGPLQSPAFMDLQTSPGVNRGKEALRVGDELWISDDTLHRITRWSRFGLEPLGVIDPAYPRLRGLALGFGSVWVTSTDAVLGNNLLELDLAGNLLNAYPMPSVPQDVMVHGSALMVTVASDDLILVDPATGTVSGIFHDSDGVTGIDAPNQVSARANGNVIAAGGLAPPGIYEYDPAGNQVAYYDTSSLPFGGGVVGCHELADGNLLFSAPGGIYVYDTLALTISLVHADVGGHYISLQSEVSLGANYCGPAVPNSTGKGASMAATGSDEVAVNELMLATYDLPPNRFGYFLASQTTGFVSNPGGSQGNLCLGGAIGRFVTQVQNTGLRSFFFMRVDLTQVPTPNGPVAVQPGETWHFTSWYRDVNPGNTSNFADGISVTFN